MDLLDVNVLVYAHREDVPNHPAYLRWLEQLLGGDEAYGSSDIILSSFLRVVTHPGIFNPPSETSAAIEFAQQVRNQPNCVRVIPGLPSPR